MFTTFSFRLSFLLCFSILPFHLSPYLPLSLHLILSISPLCLSSSHSFLFFLCPPPPPAYLVFCLFHSVPHPPSFLLSLSRQASPTQSLLFRLSFSVSFLQYPLSLSSVCPQSLLLSLLSSVFLLNLRPQSSSSVFLLSLPPQSLLLGLSFSVSPFSFSSFSLCMSLPLNPLTHWGGGAYWPPTF
jgi:hypothetical protein